MLHIADVRKLLLFRLFLIVINVFDAIQCAVM